MIMAEDTSRGRRGHFLPIGHASLFFAWAFVIAPGTEIDSISGGDVVQKKEKLGSKKECLLDDAAFHV